MSEHIEAIRARWVGVAGQLEIDYDGAYIPAARLIEGGEVVLELDEPTPAALALLERYAQAPADIRALLERIEVLLDDCWRASEVLVAAQRYREAVVTLSGINAAERALFAALDGAGDAP